MFESKKKELFSAKKATTSGSGTESAFVKSAMKETSVTSSGNGAKKYDTSGDSFVDQFSNLSNYKKPRSFKEIEKDQELLWAENKVLTVAFSLYLRMVTRVTNVFGTKTKTVQKGGGMKHEGIMRMIWLHMKQPKTFWNNVTLMISIGSWKDIFTMLQYDLVYNGWEGRKLDWNKFGSLILAGLDDKDQNNLVKKYLPQIKANSACKSVESQADNIIAKWICSLLYGSKENSYNYKQYRKLKTSGTAHEWQKLISQGNHNLIDFKSIHGRALNLLVRSKYLQNQGLLEKYEAWITKGSTEAKYTGFVNELFAKLPAALSQLNTATRETINKQFDTLVKNSGPKNSTNLIVVRDTSGSMTSIANGTNMSSYDVAKAMALYFSEFLTGPFQNAWIEFNNKAKMHTWKGNTALEKWYNDNSSYVGSTNFQSVIDLFVSLKNEIPESEFPTGILCISDGEFNPAQLGKTNVESALSKLRKAGFSKEYVDNFVICLWNIPNGYYSNSTKPKFETFANVPNVFYMSGYDPSTISFLMNGVKNAKELFLEAMNQEVLGLVTL
jgi:hypothetical protein